MGFFAVALILYIVTLFYFFISGLIQLIRTLYKKQPTKPAWKPLLIAIIMFLALAGLSVPFLQELGKIC